MPQPSPANEPQAATTLDPAGQSGRRYLIERILQEKGKPPRRVYLASAGKQLFVLKDIPQSEYKYYEDMNRSLHGCPYLRLVRDTIPERSMFVYEYFNSHLLNLAQEELPVVLTKRILKDTLRGLAALHDHNIVHTDVKANNIMIERKGGHGGMVIEQVQLADIEDAAYVPPGSAIVGRQVGNIMWRSPEAHAEGRVNKPSDIWSFGVVCVYAILKRLIFAVDKEELANGIEPLAVVLEHQISYFADGKGLDALMMHLGDSPWRQIFSAVLDGFDAANPRKPFSLWKNVDADFKDLIGGLMNFDPAQRLTAHEALAHRWFADI